MKPPIEGIMQALMRRLGAPQDADVQEMARSPFVRDTLGPSVRNSRLAGGAMRPAALEANVYGQTDGKSMFVNTAPNTAWGDDGKGTYAGTRNLRNTATHEAAHMAPAPHEDFPSYFAVERPKLWQDGEKVYRGDNETLDFKRGTIRNKATSITQALFGKDAALGQPERDAFEKLDGYYKGSRESRLGGVTTDYEGEGFAQAFSNAQGFLDENSRGLSPNFRERIGALEGNTPGAGQIVRDLLNKPIYANHPLRQVIR